MIEGNHVASIKDDRELWYLESFYKRNCLKLLQIDMCKGTQNTLYFLHLEIPNFCYARLEGMPVHIQYRNDLSL